MVRKTTTSLCYYSSAVTELLKFGPTARSQLFIQLTQFPIHYLVFVVTDDGYKYALVAMRQVSDGPTATSLLDDIGWLDVKQIAEYSDANFETSKSVETDHGEQDATDAGQVHFITMEMHLKYRLECT